MTDKEAKTIPQLINTFLAKKAAGNLKESTMSRYIYLCNKYILPYFRNMDTSDLSNDTLTAFIQHFDLKEKPLAPKTINDIIVLLLQIIRNHCDFEIDIKKPNSLKKEISVFSKAEYDKLKLYLTTETDHKKMGMMIAILTGIRLGELCALKWENVDLENGIIYIDKTIQRVAVNESFVKAKTKIIIDTPKTAASIRTIPLPLILINVLNRFKGDSDTYVLTNTLKYIEPRIYQRHFKTHLKACRIKDNHFHTLRHTFATMGIARGMDIKTLSILLGHSDVSFTMKTYVHPNLEHKRMQIEKLAAEF